MALKAGEVMVLGDKYVFKDWTEYQENILHALIDKIAEKYGGYLLCSEQEGNSEVFKIVFNRIPTVAELCKLKDELENVLRASLDHPRWYCVKVEIFTEVIVTISPGAIEYMPHRRKRRK